MAPQLILRLARLQTQDLRQSLIYCMEHCLTDIQLASVQISQKASLT